MEFPHVDLPVDLIAWTDVTEDILNIYKQSCRLKACIFALCTEGSITVSINLMDTEIKQGDFIILLPGTIIQFHGQKEKSAHLLCRIFRTLPQRSQHHPVHHELILQDYRSSRDTAQRNRCFLFPGLLRIACPHIHRAVHAQDANGAERAGHPALWCQRAIQQPSRLPKQD